MAATHISVLPTDILQMLAQTEDQPSLRFIRLPHPRTNIPCLFLPYSHQDNNGLANSSVLEVQCISPDASRSWFMDDDYVVSDGKLLLLTPIDPALLLVPLLLLNKPADGVTAQFRTAEDLLEAAASSLIVKADIITSATNHEPPNQDVLHLLNFDCVHAAMRRVCDYKEIDADTVVYRFSRVKLLEYCRAKAARVGSRSIFDTFCALTRGLAKDDLVDANETKAKLADDARLRAACELVAQYLSPEIAQELLSSYDFAALEAYLAALRDEAMEVTPSNTKQAPPAAADNKKRKATAQGSRGVQKLAKVTTTGMTKLSSFFAKKA